MSNFPQDDTGPQLHRPHFTFKEAIQAFFKNYSKFDGRASRSEYWWVYLAYTILTTVLLVPLFTMGLKFKDVVGDDPSILHLNATGWAIFGLLVIIGLVTLIPNIALSIRRLHDSNKSGWWYLITLVPYIGSIILFIFMCLKSNPEGKRFDGVIQPWTPEKK